MMRLRISSHCNIPFEFLVNGGAERLGLLRPRLLKRHSGLLGGNRARRSARARMLRPRLPRRYSSASGGAHLELLQQVRSTTTHLELLQQVQSMTTKMSLYLC